MVNAIAGPLYHNLLALTLKKPRWYGPAHAGSSIPVDVLRAAPDVLADAIHYPRTPERIGTDKHRGHDSCFEGLGGAGRRHARPGDVTLTRV